MTHAGLPGYWWHLLLLCGTLIAVCLVDRCGGVTVHPDGSYTWRNPFTWETVTYLKDGTIIRVDMEGNVHKSEYCDPDGNVKKVV